MKSFELLRCIQQTIKSNTNKSLVLFTLLFSTLLVSYAQPPIEWEYNYGGSAVEGCFSIIQTADSGFIGVGQTFSNDGDISSGTVIDRDVWIVKLNQNGTLDWEKTYGGQGAEFAVTIVQTYDGGYAFAARITAPGGDVSSAIGTEDFWIVRIGSNGNIEWEHTFGGSKSEIPQAIIQTADSGFLVYGWTASTDGDVSGNHGSIDNWLVKLSSSGSLEWAKTYGGSLDDRPSAGLIATYDGGYAFMGYSKSSDGDVGANYGYWDLWFVKIDNAGIIDWEKNYGGPDWDEATMIVQTADSGYVLSSFSASSSGDVSGNNGGWDVWVLKITKTGEEIEWESNYGGLGEDRGNSIEVIPGGGYYVGAFSGSTDGDVSSSKGGFDYWALRLDATGGLVWEKSLGGSSQDFGSKLLRTFDGGLVFAGSSSSSDQDVSSNNGGLDMWFIKLESEAVDDCNCAQGINKSTICHVPSGNAGNPQTLCISTSALNAHLGVHSGDYCGPCLTSKNNINLDNGNQQSDDIFRAFPNPFITEATIKFTVIDDSHVKIEIFNVSGSGMTTLFEGVVAAGELNQVRFAPDDLSGGLYIYRATRDEEVYYGKLILAK